MPDWTPEHVAKSLRFLLGDPDATPPVLPVTAADLPPVPFSLPGLPGRVVNSQALLSGTIDTLSCGLTQGVDRTVAINRLVEAQRAAGAPPTPPEAQVIERAAPTFPSPRELATGQPDEPAPAVPQKKPRKPRKPKGH